ncbi:ribonuclease E/G [Benzoatithermus flavus]|uniref:Ribonuclease E/G n=1 Tax=Benzoatithermus flavus TaxID=3108223 RepID=A0ABU8XPL5_9PROT
MTTRIVLEDTGFGIRAAVLDGDDRLIEIRDVDRDDPRVTDALFAARVTAVDPKLNAAFLDCGLPQPGLIVAKDARAAAGSAERRPIKELLREGQRLIVQGLREAVGDKGPRFTSDIRLFGYALVHTPLTATVEVSHQLGRRQADELRERGRTLFPEGRFVLRRHAARVTDEALMVEAKRLADRWRRIEAAAKTAKPGRLPEMESPLERLLRGLIELEPEAVAVADRNLARELERLLATPGLPPLELVRLDPDEPAFAQAGVDAALETALSTLVPLPRGGRLLIEETAACVAIDVDGGGRSPLDVDLEAAGEIARQVRLRNLGGTILIDFVDLPSKPERQRLEEALRKAFRHDPAPFEIHPVSSLGTVLVSRARRGQPLSALLQAACTSCGGSGRRPSPRVGAERLLGALGRRRRPARVVRVARDLGDFLADGQGRAAWRHLARCIGYEPPLVIDPSLAPASFDLDTRNDGD